MKIKVDTEKFRDALAIANHGVARRATMPVLGTVLLEATKSNQKLRITGNSLDFCISVTTDAEIDEDHAICIHGQRLSQISAAVEGESATITKKGSNIKFECGRSTFTIHGIPSEEFPVMEPLDMENAAKFSQDDFRNRLVSVEAAQSEDETRYTLNGTCIERKGVAMNLIATDGRRLHINKTILPEKVENSSIIIPRASSAKLCALLGDKGDVLFANNNRKAHFVIEREDGNISFITKLVEAIYPNWDRVVPAAAPHGITINAQIFMDAVRRVALATSEKAASVKVTIKGNTLHLYASSADEGEADEYVACENPGSVEGEFAAHPSFLSDAVEATQSETVVMEVNSSASAVSPIVFRGGSVSSVVMPVRLS